MDLMNIVLLMLITVIAFQFWHVRAMNELAIVFARQYCNKHQLQFLSVARESTKIAAFRGRLGWCCRFRFEFSSNGESLNSGTFIMQGKRVVELDVPAYPIP